MTHEIVSVTCNGPGVCLQSVDGLCMPVTFFDNTSNRCTPCQAYQRLLQNTKSDIIIYIHDDVTVHDGWWLQMVVDCFKQLFPGNDPREPQETVAVGLGGATSLGRPALYKEPYNIMNMARGGYASNQTDAEVHGERFTGVRQVAVLDAFFMAVRTDFLRNIGGWPVDNLSHHCLDLWIACEARRHNKEIWMVGASCTHHGGGSSTKPVYRDAKWLQGGSMEEDHQRPHRWLYEEYRDVLPFSV